MKPNDCATDPSQLTDLEKQQLIALQNRITDQQRSANRRLIPAADESAESKPPAAEGAMKEESSDLVEAAKQLLRELNHYFVTRSSSEKRKNFVKLVSLQAARSELANAIVRECMDESQEKDDPGPWFVKSVLLRLREQNCWDRNTCRQFNRTKRSGRPSEAL